ncbi:glycosyltransferase [Robertmurraya sp. FSL R5-0851]|uniref:glycosyltransferase n=1 Tax=Robertmurraya sp. FSL R5-0851 TaxID=2921584 RepID=UPI0030F4BC0F
MKRKKLLFVMPSLAPGGGEKSLINLLHEINYEEYSVDLLLLSRKGIFLKQIPVEVNIFELQGNYTIFTKGLIKSVITFVRQGKLELAFNRLVFSLINRLYSNKSIAEQMSWKYISNSIEKLEGTYDAAIGYLEKTSIYYVIDKVNASKKIGWIHTNYSNSGLNPKLDVHYFKQLDYTATVSEECANSLEKNFPELRAKIKVIYNIVSPSNINFLANKDLKAEIREENTTSLLTVARISYEKGIDIAIEACRLLVNNGYKIKWFIIGDGEERDNILSLIREKGIEENFILLGVKDNPYKYMKNVDIYVQPSRYEGKSIAIDEAKILCKPIVVTNFETVKDQIIHGTNGSIAGTTPESISQAIEELINNNNYKYSLQRNLEREKVGTVEEIEKLYQLI